MSQRHSTEAMDHTRTDPVDDPYLDAVRECVMAVGVRRTTATDVARRAGVSRMTLYRRFPDVAAMIAALMTREFTGVLRDAALEAAAREPARARLVGAAVIGAERIASNDLWRRIVDVDPELLLPYVTRRLGGVQEAGLLLLQEQVAAGIADGSIRDEDPRRLATTIELVLRGHVLAAHAATSTQRARTCLELERMLDGYLRPDAHDDTEDRR
jgi:AcrR family transcriptional regulator